MVKRLFVLVVLLVPALAWGACPRTIAGSYAVTTEEDNGDGTNEFGIALVTFNRPTAGGAGTGSTIYSAGGESGPDGDLAEEDTTTSTFNYTYAERSCRGRIFFRQDGGDRTVFFVVGENGNRIMGVYSDPSDVGRPQINRLTFFRQ